MAKKRAARKTTPRLKTRVKLTGPKGETIFEGTDREFKDAVHRITTHKPNGGLSTSEEVAPAPVPIGEAMRRAVEALGEVVIDEQLAPGQLRQLAECFEDVTRMQAAFIARSEEAKTAKKALDSATNLLLEKVRMFTHTAPLPLFDHERAEADHAAMTAEPDAVASH